MNYSLYIRKYQGAGAIVKAEKVAKTVTEAQKSKQAAKAAKEAKIAAKKLAEQQKMFNEGVFGIVSPSKAENVYTQRKRAKGAPEEHINIPNYDLTTMSDEAIKELAREFANGPHNTSGHSYETILSDLMDAKADKGAYAAFGATLIPENFPYYLIAKVHESEHAARIPAVPVPPGTLNLAISSYFLRNNNTEIGARIAQVLSAFGFSTPIKLNGPMLLKMFDRYFAISLTSDKALNNNIKNMTDFVIDWDKLASWANDPRNVYAIMGMMTAAGAASANSENNENNGMSYGNYVLQ